MTPVEANNSNPYIYRQQQPYGRSYQSFQSDSSISMASNQWPSRKKSTWNDFIEPKPKSHGTNPLIIIFSAIAGIILTGAVGFGIYYGITTGKIEKLN